MKTKSMLPWRPPPRFLLIFTAIHFTLGVASLLSAFSMGMARFDNGQAATFYESAAETAALVLLSPAQQWLLGSDLGFLFPGLLGYLPLLVNSLLWSVAAWLLLTLCNRVLIRSVRHAS